MMVSFYDVILMTVVQAVSVTLKTYILFIIFLGQVVSFKYAMQIPTDEILLVKAINMRLLLCFLETGKHFSQGDVFV